MVTASDFSTLVVFLYLLRNMYTYFSFVLLVTYVFRVASTPTVTSTETPQNSNESNEDLIYSSCNKQESSNLQALLQEYQNCTDCSNGTRRNFTAEDIHRLKLEVIKLDMLQKMQKKGPSCRVGPKPSLDRILRALENDDVVDEPMDSGGDNESSELIQKLIRFPVNTDFQCYDRQVKPCSRFEFLLPDYVDASNFVSAHLEIKVLRWIRRRPLRVSSLFGLNYTWDKVSFGSRNAFGGVRFALRTSSFHRNITVEAYGNAVAETGADKPFLLVQRKDKQSKSLPRSRRHIECSDTTTSCCRQTKYVTFAELYWDDFVLEPVGFHANFCKGHCLNTFDSFQHLHGTIFHTIDMFNKSMIQDLGISTCCTPTEFANLTMLYVEEDGSIVKNTFQNMIVKSCGCR